MSPNTKPLLVILPGAFHTPESYRRITEPLLSKGYEVLAVDYLVTARSSEPDPNPTLSFTDDATALREKLIPLFNEGGEAVLISHSYGSLPATHTAVGQTTVERNERGERGGVAAVINIAGFAFPARGRNIMGEESETPAMPYQVVKNGTTHLQPTAKPLFFSGLPQEEVDAEWERLALKQTRKSMTDFPEYIESEIQCPKTYILCEEDQAVPPAFQEHMAGVGGYKVVRVKSGHSPFLSIPGEIVRIVEDVVGKLP
ncbi:Alpha/beta hydrolase fold-1 [Aspergillus pseudodeflectus]|uniref:Alpha/beta hydrolase fold-1 n=1 Tax=Aspergillus pseudodeflectus TaxID=176178 RepID=A0ABR4KWT9_9EURO